jgi:uncharacterized protein YecE (DUF72 family)
LKFYIGCSGWNYSAWKGPFYPPTLENSDWLRYYSNVFDYVEIDSSFYRIPNQFMIKNWFKKTPDNFRFTAKFPKIITHDKHLVDVEKEVELFLRNMEPLHDKTLALLIQLPPSMQITPGLEGLRQLVSLLDKRFRYAVEVRHQSWFQDLAYNFFANNNLCMVWSQLAGIRTPPIVTTDFLYIRFIGDRSIDESDFGKVQKDRVLEMNKWAGRIKRVRQDRGHSSSSGKEISLAIVPQITNMQDLDLELLICLEKWLVCLKYPGQMKCHDNKLMLVIHLYLLKIIKSKNNKAGSQIL